MGSADDLRVLLSSRHPLILVAVDDEARFLELLRRAALTAGYPVWIWSVTRGLARDGFGAQVGTTDPLKALAFVAALPDPGVFVMADARAALADASVVRMAKEIALAARPGQTLVLTGPTNDLPPELQGLGLAWRLEPPTPQELDDLVRRTLDDLAARQVPVTLDSAEPYRAEPPRTRSFWWERARGSSCFVGPGTEPWRSWHVHSPASTSSTRSATRDPAGTSRA